MREVKQVLVVRKDLTMRKGKIAAQCAHASLAVVLEQMYQIEQLWSDDPPDLTSWILEVKDNSPLGIWLNARFTKIVVYVESEEELLAVYEQAKAAGLLCSLITDAGLTEFHGQPTKTVVAVGPGWSDEIDQITGHLKLL